MQNDDSMLHCSIAGLDQSAMPDHEELDSLPSINLESSYTEEVYKSLIILLVLKLKFVMSHEIECPYYDFVVIPG